MSIEELMKLVNAGFTKEEIMALTGNVNTPKEVNNEQSVNDTPVENKAEVIEETKTTTESTPQTTNVNFVPMMTDSQVEKLAQMLNRGTATIDVPAQRDTNKILGEHFSNLMNGKE